MYNTPKPRPQFGGPGGSNGVEGLIDFDQKQSVSSSSAVTTTPSTSNSSSTPGTSSFSTEGGGYLEEINNMMESSRLETPQVARLGGSQILTGVGVGNSNPNNEAGQYSLGPSMSGANDKGTLSANNSAPGLISNEGKSGMNLDGYHHTGVLAIGRESRPMSGGGYRNQMIVPVSGAGVGITSNMFTSQNSFDCTITSTGSTSATFAPSIRRDDCSPRCRLPAPPGSDSFSISTFRPEQIGQGRGTITGTTPSVPALTKSAGSTVSGVSTSGTISDPGIGAVLRINEDGSDSISGDFSAPMLNYLSDRLGADSWGSFMPYTNLIDYCFDGGPSHVDGMIERSSCVGSTNGENGGTDADLARWLTGKGVSVGTSVLPEMMESGCSESLKGVSRTVGKNGGVPETTRVLMTATNAAPNVSVSSDIKGKALNSTPCALSSYHGTSSPSSPSLRALKANDLVEKLIMDIVNDNRQQNTSVNRVFDQASEILTLALSNLGSKFNRDAVISTPVKSLGGNNWGQNSLGVGGPNFAAPTMLAHPDEFKNPSSFLKIYGDPLCGRSATGVGSSATQSSTGICSMDSPTSPSVTTIPCGTVSGVTLGNINPTKGQNGNWSCSKCSNVNFPRRFRCFKCGEYRDEAGDKIVAEYAKHVYLHHLRAYRSIGSNWILGSAGGGAMAAPQCSGGFSVGHGSSPSLTTGPPRGAGTHPPHTSAGFGQDHLSGTRAQRQATFPQGGSRSGFFSNARSGQRDGRDGGGTNGIPPGGGVASHTNRRHHKTSLVTANS